jgi:hypothetical protein
LLAVGLGVFLLSSRESSASVGLTPLRLDIYAEPGGPPEVAWLTVTNTSDERRDIALTPESFEIARDGSLRFEPRLREERGASYVPPAYSGASFITIKDSPMTLDPGESRRVPCRVSLPANALGEYYAMITANPGPATPVHSSRGDRSVRVTFEISAVVVIVAGVVRPPRAPGDYPTVDRATPARYDVQATDLRVVFPKPGEPRQTLRIAGTFANRGNTHILADIRAEVRNVDERRKIEDVLFGGGARLVLPNTERDILGEVTSPVPPGRYQVELTVRWGDEYASATRKTSCEVLVPIAGAIATTKRLGILGVSPERVVVTTHPGKVVREDIVLTNNVDDPIAVVVKPVDPAGAPVGISVAPSRFVMPPGAERTIQPRIAVSKDATSDIHEFAIALEPIASNGDRFPEAESRTIALVLRILPPPSEGGKREKLKTP